MPVGGFGPLRIWGGCAERPAAGREGAAESRLRRDPLPSPPRYRGREMGGHTLRLFRCRGRQRRLRRGEGGKANGTAYPSGQRELLSPEAWGCPESRGGRECGRTPPTPGAGACLSFNSKEVTQPLGCVKNKRVPFPTAPAQKPAARAPPPRGQPELPELPLPFLVGGAGGTRGPAPCPPAASPGRRPYLGAAGRVHAPSGRGKGGSGGSGPSARGAASPAPALPASPRRACGEAPAIGDWATAVVAGSVAEVHIPPPGVGGGCCPPGPGLPRRGEVMRRRRGRGNANRPRNCLGGIGANREGKGS